MHLPHLTVAPSIDTLTRPTPEEAAAQLQGRCTGRVCYAQKTTPTGDRVYGHFSMTADSLADTLDRQIFPQDHEDANSPEFTLHRWLRDHDRADEIDEPVTALPATWSGLEQIVEELFSENHTRVFCTCCNRNLAPRDVRLERSSRHADGVRYRYFCTEGHLLLNVQTGHRLPVEERHAA